MIIRLVETDSKTEIPSVLGDNYSLLYMSLLDASGNEVNPDGSITVRIPYASNLRPTAVHHFGDNFEIDELLEFKDFGTYIEVYISEFSYFGVKYSEKTVNPEIPIVPTMPDLTAVPVVNEQESVVTPVKAEQVKVAEISQITQVATTKVATEVSDEEDEVIESEEVTDEEEIKETAINTLMDQSSEEESESMWVAILAAAVAFIGAAVVFFKKRKVK